jgi:outer membrane protein assembly factor BamE
MFFDHIRHARPMPAFSSRLSRLALCAAACAAAAGCSSFNSATQRIASVVTPYKVPVVQGNFVSREQVQALKPGMTRNEVRELLGTPLVASVFHANRWDYVFTLRRQGVPLQSHRLTLLFKGEVLESFEGDPMPSEAEFVTSLDASRKGTKVPVLEASPAQLERFPPPATPEAAPPAPATATNYPPLEPIAR